MKTSNNLIIYLTIFLIIIFLNTIVYLIIPLIFPDDYYLNNFQIILIAVFSLATSFYFAAKASHLIFRKLINKKNERT